MTQTKRLRIGVTLGALVIAALHVLKPDLRIDTITVVLLIVAVLPWVQPLIKSIELLGVKLELQEIKSELADAKGAAESADRKAEFALLAATPASSIDIETAKVRARDNASESFAQLMGVYEHIRANQSSGATRTQAMTEVVRKMIELAPSVEGFDVREALMSDQRGRRLAAYCHLYARPDFRFIEPLAMSVTEVEDKPFGQYWGLQAISRLSSSGEGMSVPDSVRVLLRKYLERVPRGTDRDYEVRKILRELGDAVVSD